MWELVPLVVIVLLFFLLVIRPQQRRQRAMGDLQSSLAVGDEVMLTSGFFGTIRALHDDRFDVEIAEGITVQVARGAIGRVVAPEEHLAADPTYDTTQDDTTQDDAGTEPGASKEG